MTERRYGATEEETFVRDAFEGYTLDELFENFCEDGESLVFQLASHVRELERRVEALETSRTTLLKVHELLYASVASIYDGDPEPRTIARRALVEMESVLVQAGPDPVDATDWCAATAPDADPSSRA